MYNSSRDSQAGTQTVTLPGNSAPNYNKDPSKEELLYKGRALYLNQSSDFDSWQRLPWSCSEFGMLDRLRIVRPVLCSRSSGSQLAAADKELDWSNLHI